MTEQYPFSLSESTVNRLRSRSNVELARWLERLNLPPASCTDKGPHIFASFDDWLLHLDSKVHALRWITDQVAEVLSSSEEEMGLHYALEATAASVEAEVDRFDDLLTWGKASWQDDPAVEKKTESTPTPEGGVS
jgi:hypothetical protein